jgi:hypothetical protein
VPVGGASAARILTGDVYEWIPGSLRRAARRLRPHGRLAVGGVEIIGYDAESGTYTSHFVGSQGHVSVDELLYDDGSWTWRGQRIRTTSTVSDDGRVQHSLHEQSDDGVRWRPSMDVTLKRID